VKKWFAALSMLCIALWLKAEIRAMWVLPWDINTPQAVDEMIHCAVQNNQNELLVEVRYRSDALYDTSLGAALYPNPEPRSYILKNDGYDPLQYTLTKAQEAGLKVQAWVIVFNATPLDNSLIQQNYIYNNHRDWITCGPSGNRFNGSRQFGYFLDPGVPAVQDYLINVISNLAAGYPQLDGIHLDYIRYPETNLGYHPESVARYEEYCRNQQDITFNEWRIMQVSGFVERLHQRVKEINPRLLLTAAVFADLADANVAYAQEWQDWLQRGIIERVYPMAYNMNFKSHTAQLERMKLIGCDDRIVIGQRAWDDKGRALNSLGYGQYNLAELAKRIEQTRDLGFAGVAMFSYAGLKTGNAWSALKKLSFSEPSAYQEVASAPSVAMPETPPVQTAVEAKLYRTDAHLLMVVSIPQEGLWNCEIYSGELLATHQHYYQQGENRDILELSLPESQTAPLNNVVVQLFRDDSDYRYLIPVEIQNLHE